MTDNDLKDLIEALLKVDQPMEKTPLRFSTIAMLLKSARENSGCDLNSGVYQFNELNIENVTMGTYLPLKYSGLISYLIFLEQIGSALNLKDTQGDRDGIINAITNFSSRPIEIEKAQAIKSLRNSLVHRFGLATERKPKFGKPYRFTLNLLSENEDIIILPSHGNEWDGEFSRSSSNNSVTEVYLINLIELIEGIYQRILVENGQFRVTLRIGQDELMARYTITA
jgi:hypothetical protein